MYPLEHSIDEMTDVISDLPGEGFRQVEASLRQLTREQVLFVRDALKIARREERMPVHRISFIEYLLQEWWEHSLATKLAVVTRVISLSDTQSWPGDAPGDQLVNEIVEQVDVVAV